MTHSRYVLKVLTCCSGISLMILSGCAPTKSEQFKTAFLPPATRAAETPDPEPILKETQQSSPFLINQLPNNTFLTNPPAAKGSDIDHRLRRAEQALEAGKRAYQDGRTDDARRSFDEAVDVLLRAPDGAPDRAKLEQRLDKLVETIYRYDVNGLGSGEDDNKVVFDKSPLDGILELTFPTDPRLKPQVEQELRATVSELPLEENDAVLSYIHFFSSERGKRILTAGLRRAGRYRPLIERVLEEEGVPQELIYLAQAESGFMPRAVSHKRAAGMWQFVAVRGREYGLQVTRQSDDRLDPEKATRAAARHLRDLYEQFGDWYLALAAYNCGPGCVDRAVQRTGYADFWSLRRLNVLPRETSNYVPAIIAITIMVKNSEDYGVNDIEADPPIVYDTLKLDAATNLLLVADALERPAAEVRELNPGLLRGVAPAGYELHVPQGSSDELAAALEMVPAVRRADSRMHRVESGDTLAMIAKRYRTAASAIAAANADSNLDSPDEGDLLVIPAAYREARPVAKRSTKRSSSTKSSKTAAAASRNKIAMRGPASRNASSKSPHPEVRSRTVRSASLGAAAGGQ